jgi:bifunctional NMN adenylyltransferase/nudix hydrolase
MTHQEHQVHAAPPAPASKTNRKHDYAVLIGRFQPFHFGHQRLVEHALRTAARVVIVVGSDKQHRSVKNPFTFEERERMIRATLRGTEQARVSVVGVADSPYNDSIWIASIQNGVDTLIAADGADTANVRVALVGHLKDDSSYYLKLFPKWQFLGFESVESLNATDIRSLYFDPVRIQELAPELIPDGTAAVMDGFLKTQHYQHLVEEQAFLQDYKTKYRYAGSDFPPIFSTVDAVVVEAGYILLVQRKFSPGKGTWALPGGFIGQHETLLDASIRELKEETKLKVPTPVLKGSIKGQQVFDAPQRSQRGRTITYAFHFELTHNQWTGLSEIRAADDAADARWWPLSAFFKMQDQIYEDHFFIANHFLGGLGA